MMMDVPVKNREWRKFFLCFKPETSDDGSVKPASSEDESSRKNKKKTRRSFSRAMKAVLFETSLMKKIQGKRSRKNSFRSNSNLSSKSEKTVKKTVSYKELSNPKEIFRTTSNYSSSLFSSNPSSRSTSISSNTFASSISSNPRSLSEIKRSASFDFQNLNINKQVSKKGFVESYAGICIFLVSLFSLVIWGKVFAILTCTSTCLFFGPRPRVESPVNDVYTEEHKKRVIMEGMLERNRSRMLLP
ncbi:uncharacterized protein Fot_48595 [Forsythia ovata]|uniref:Uncharacterized protein n=1 Tax=Forsythia ovata TaxID=205694 RepID=A0ABD1QAH0_9LAMI